MSSGVHQVATESRGDCSADREVTEEDVSVYVTPKPETPYGTPCSTPRLIHCRLKPVKTIRQHVPLKMNFSLDESSATDRAALSKFDEIKPMSTKTVRCVLQPNPLYRDGEKSNHGDAGDATYSKDCHSQVPSELHSNGTDAVSIHCHSRGDGEIKEAAETAASAIFSNHDNQPADDFQCVAVIEKEIQMMDRFVKNSIKRLQNCCDEKPDADNGDPTVTDNHRDNHKTQEKPKNDRTSAKIAPMRKSTCVQENHDAPCATHKCEKKKFYDKDDIRRYMMKKKSERQAKEKEERHKRETEAMAMKRKAEASKGLITKTRIPVPRSHNVPEHEVDNKIKNGPKVKIESTCCSKPMEEPKPTKTQFHNEKNVERRRYSKHLPEKYSTQEGVNINEHSKVTNGGEKISGHEYDKTLGEINGAEKYFARKFNQIITKCAEEAANMTLQGQRCADRDSTSRISAKIKPTQNISKRSPPQIENAVSLPEELDVLKSKNPYNFLNILKGKVNLAKNSKNIDSEDVHDEHLLNKAFPLSPPKKKNLSKSDKDAFLENIIERRLKLGNSIPLAMKLNEIKSSEEYENVEPVMTLKSELTLDDLNLSPTKPDQTYLVHSTKKSDKTFILGGKDANEMSNRNTATSFELSGIKSLSGTDEKVSSKLSLKGDKICDNRGNIMKNYGDVEFTEKLNSLNRTLSLESLKAHNVSLSLPDSFIGRQDKENFDLSMRNLSMDFRKLMEDESIFGKGNKDTKTSSFITKLEEKSINDVQKSISNESSAFSSDTIANLSTTAVFFDIYDQMMKSEDEKLAQILKKIHQQKEALNKYLKTEVYALESRKKTYRENADELDAVKTMKIKIMKQRQRAILLKITKNIQELDKMKKSVIETVEKRKAEILRQKSALIEKKEAIKQKLLSSKKKKAEDTSRTFLVSKQSNTLFMGISSSSSASIFLENGENQIKENKEPGELDEQVGKEGTNEEQHFAKLSGVKDTATSPVHFNSEISIRLELDPEKLLKIRNPCNEIKIDATKLTENAQSSSFRPINQAPSESEDNAEGFKEREKIEGKSTMIKIKRPLSPVVFPNNKKVCQMRRLSSSSDVTFASLNDTTTDQSDVELRISALQEQLRQRKMEAERLRREEKQLRKEKLRAKEQSLLKQLEAYDKYIQRVTKMLSEDTSVIEVAKPQIKPTSRRPSFSEISDKKIKPIDFNEKLTPSQPEDNISKTKTKNYIDDLEAETNTEDSEKHLRKADSGILMESEVTEVSENIEIGKSESEIHSERKSEREGDKVGSEVEAGGTKSVDNFLQLINDIQSEVVSMSEQVYSSDFVEDIPEDLADDKSETSNDLNTSVSIEEILSDQHYHSDTESKPDSIKQPTKAIKDVVPGVTSEAVSLVGESTLIHTNEVITEELNSETGLFVVKNMSEIESMTSDHVEVTVPSQLEEIHPTDSANEQTIEEVRSTDSAKDIERTSIDEPQPSDSVKNTPNEHFSLEEIKSGSSLETPMTEIKESSMFFDYSRENNTNDAANTESIVNHEFVKYESEGSSVADVDEPVRKVDDIETMMDGFHSNDFTLSDETISEEAQKNFEEVLKNLGSYFSMKISPVDVECAEIKSLGSANVERGDFADAPEVKAESPSNVVSLVKSPEVGPPEETDISESLEYDTTSAENSDARYKIEFTLSEKKPNQVTDLDEDDKNEPIVSQPDSEKSNVFESVQKKSNEELSAEEDRSVEEFLEDYSMPNLVGTTFIVNEDDDANSDANASVEIRTLTPSPVQSSIPEIHVEINQDRDEDLDQKISMDQTPFLQALRRESESFFGQNSGKCDVVPEVFDKVVENLAGEVNEIIENKNIDTPEEEKVSDAINEANSAKTNAKVDESVLRKHVSKLDNDWFDKELSFNRERLREAEELRLQQIRIEQEIEELQAQQHIPPYIYIREIPNKPPPPYTPPSEHKALKIPSNENELRTLTFPTIQYVCSSLKKGLKIDEIKQLPEYSSTGKSNTEVTTFKKFIFHLTKEVARNILENSKIKTCLPWENLSKNKPKVPPGEEDLPKIIENEILILFGFKSKINKEKLIIQWSRKKRNDFVDDLLIRELQEEEAEWTNYEEDENIIKNQITQSLLDDLIQDTVESLNDAFSVKNKLTSNE